MTKSGSAIMLLAIGAILCGLSAVSTMAVAEEKPYTEGSVWAVTMVRVKPGMLDVYMRDILPLRKKINEEAKKQGLLLSSHVLSGNSAARDDYNVMILEEYKNWAAFDGITAKYEAIAEKMIGSEDKQVQMMVKRGDTREIVGNKNMQELIIK